MTLEEILANIKQYQIGALSDKQVSTFDNKSKINKSKESDN